VAARLGNKAYNGVPVDDRRSLGLVSREITREYRQQTLRDTAMHYLSLAQKQLVVDQVRRVAVEEMRQRGFFPRVEPLTTGSPTREGDYVLVVHLLRKIAPKEIRGRVFYGTEVLPVGSSQTVMRDGPLPDFYFGQRWGGMLIPGIFPDCGGCRPEILGPECRAYELPVYMTEGLDVAYISGGRLRELLGRTFMKLSMTVLAHRAGQPLPFTDDCCYCLGR